MLTVTTWGIDSYDEFEASSAADRVPFVLNRVTVTPKPLTAPVSA